MSDYPKFKPIPRHRRPITITEKIDGTNGLIWIGRPTVWLTDEVGQAYQGPSTELHLRAGARNGWLTPEKDNFGFCRWAYDNVNTLIADLGEGHHYGEWWGHGIQRGYGLLKGERRFSLFNTGRWGNDEVIGWMTPNLCVVPTIRKEVPNSESEINFALSFLEAKGSLAASGFRDPEGIVIYHHAADRYSKITLKNDDEPKSKVKNRGQTL